MTVRTESVAAVVEPLAGALLPRGLPVRLEFWDGSALGPADGPGTVRFCSPDAVRRLVWAPDELGLGRAFVTGEVDIDGDLAGVLRSLKAAAGNKVPGPEMMPRLVVAARRLGVLHRPLPIPPEEARPRGLRHSKARDAETVRHHYDVGNEFYRLVLGPSMTYSCARFPTPGATLEEAQRAKHELICRKLGLRPGSRLLDVGCGWGSMAMHAAAEHGAVVVGVTLSPEQAEEARRRVKEAGLDTQVEIRVQDYRDLRGERFDAISSVGMFEHVGRRMADAYFETLRSLLGPGGRLLNHAISSVGGSRLGRRSFMHRYVFPDGELHDVGDTVLRMERAGFEVRDVESLREHYARTLGCWIANLEAHWSEAVALVGETRARVWRLYMSGSANGFADGGLGIHQVLGVVPFDDGASGLPLTRAEWES